MSNEYRKIYTLKNEQIENINLRYDNQEDVDMEKDNLDIDNDIEDDLNSVFEKLKIY